MNKTVNINLAGILFHIDEDAYNKLQNYLEAIKRSFANTPGYDEIVADIEARIAELFSERLKSERQVVSMLEVDEVIAIMGQPEDYMVDEEMFEDQNSGTYTASPGKKLFRDTDSAYIAGVSSGLAHYMGIQAIWIRLLWVLLTIFSSGIFIIFYILLWIFIPEAMTTAEKLAMRGEPVNISNIERKIKEGFDDVSGKVKNVDYQKYGYKARSGANSAATAVGSAVSVILDVIVKLVGIIILVFAGATIISLFIGLFTLGTFGIIEAPWTDYIAIATSGEGSIWIISLLSFLTVGIPFFFLFILGLKILVKNLKSIGRTAKLVLLGLWILSVLGLSIWGIMQGADRAFDGEFSITETLPVKVGDTLTLSMRSNANYDSSTYRNSEFYLKYNENDERVIYSGDLRLVVRSTRDSTGRIEILKTAEGKNHRVARERAANIDYDFQYQDRTLLLDSYFTTGIENKYRDQEVQVNLFLPIGTILFADRNTSSFHRNSSYYDDILRGGEEEKYLQITEGGTQCLDCPEESFEEDWETIDEEWDKVEDTKEATDSVKTSIKVKIGPFSHSQTTIRKS